MSEKRRLRRRRNGIYAGRRQIPDGRFVRHRLRTASLPGFGAVLSVVAQSRSAGMSVGRLWSERPRGIEGFSPVFRI